MNYNLKNIGEEYERELYEDSHNNNIRLKIKDNKQLYTHEQLREQL